MDKDSREEIRLVIAGTRSFGSIASKEQRIEEVDDAVRDAGYAPEDIAEVVSGACGRERYGSTIGADGAGEEWAQANDIRVLQVPAEWDKLGKRAGPRRNKIMAEYADALVALWDGKSKGTLSMIELGGEHFGPDSVHIHPYRGEDTIPSSFHRYL